MKKRITVLIIEDNPGDADLIQSLLSEACQAKFQFIIATRLADALVRLEQDEIGMALVDLNLPDSSGLDTIRKLRKSAGGLPLVVITGNDDEETVMATLREGVQDYLIKGRLSGESLERGILYAMERHEAQKQLHESELFLRSILDALTGHIVILENDGRIMSTNKAWRDFAMANHADLGKVMEGANYLAVCESVREHEEAAVARDFAAGIRSVLAGKSDFFEMEYPCDSPEEKRWFVGRVSPFFSAGDRRVVIVHDNITSRKQAELESMKNLKLLNETQQLSKVGGWDYDPASNRIIWTDEVYRIHGLSKGEHDPSDISKNIEFYAPEDRKKIEQVIQQAVAKGQSYDLTLRFHAADGRRLWVRTLGHAEWQDGQIKRISGNIMDVTESKQAQDSLLESEMRMRTILNAMDDIIILMDMDLKILWPNLAACDAAGLAREEMLGKHCFEVSQARSDVCSGCPVEKAVRSGLTHTDTFVNRKGRTLFLKGCPVTDTAGKIVGAVEVAVDITERLRLEEQLRQAQKMESIGLLAGGIAHDFNNILSAIIGYTELAQQRNLSGDKLNDYLTNVLKSGHRAKNLVYQILAFSRQAESSVLPVKMSLIIKEAIKMLRATLPTTISLKQKFSVDGNVMGDPTQIHQVVMNLCINAHHAMRENGGNLTVGIEEDDMALVPDAPPISTRTGYYLRMVVSDTGTGMEENVRKHLFEPYFTTKPKGEGTGLGLSVVYGIVKNHGGMIRVESEPGKGTTFHLYFPKHADPDPVKPLDNGREVPGGKERILFVDDEDILTLLIKRLLEPLGYHVTVFTDPLEALEHFRHHPDQYDLVMTDMTMPKMASDTLALELMAVRPDIPVMICTGFSERINEDQAKRIGVRALLKKPFEKKHMAEEIRRAIDNNPSEKGMV